MFDAKFKYLNYELNYVQDTNGREREDIICFLFFHFFLKKSSYSSLLGIILLLCFLLSFLSFLFSTSFILQYLNKKHTPKNSEVDQLWKFRKIFHHNLPPKGTSPTLNFNISILLLLPSITYHATKVCGGFGTQV